MGVPVHVHVVRTRCCREKSVPTSGTHACRGGMHAPRACLREAKVIRSSIISSRARLYEIAGDRCKSWMSATQCSNAPSTCISRIYLPPGAACMRTRRVTAAAALATAVTPSRPSDPQHTGKARGRVLESAPRCCFHRVAAPLQSAAAEGRFRKDLVCVCAARARAPRHAQRSCGVGLRSVGWSVGRRTGRRCGTRATRTRHRPGWRG